MKNTIQRTIILVGFVVLFGAASVLADGPDPVPLCYPRQCPLK